jgi:hypothetical protein
LARRQIALSLTGPSIHSQLKSISVSVDVAGQHHVESFAPATNLSSVFTWDGRDGFGRRFYGSATAQVVVTTTYPGIYYSAAPAVGGTSESQRSSFALSSLQPGTAVSGDRNRTEISFTNSYSVKVEAPPPLDGWALGGWTLSPNHFYASQGVLNLGTGESRIAAAVLGTVERVAGDGSTTLAPDGTDARDTGVYPFPAAANADGLVGFDSAPNGDIYYFAGALKLMRIDRRDNKIWSVAGGQQYFCSGASGDGGPATQAVFSHLSDIAIGGDGSVYLADMDARQIRRIRPDGIIERLAGSAACTSGHAGDGGPATSARLVDPRRIAVAQDGSLYVLQGDFRIRKIDPSGIITTVAGNGSTTFGGVPEGVPATSLPSPLIRDIAVGPNGVLHMVGNKRIFGLQRDGTIKGISAEFSASNALDDGVPIATEAVDLPTTYSAISSGMTGKVYFFDLDVSQSSLQLPVDSSYRAIRASEDAGSLANQPHRGGWHLRATRWTSLFGRQPTGRHFYRELTRRVARRVRPARIAVSYLQNARPARLRVWRRRPRPCRVLGVLFRRQGSAPQYD